MKKITLLLVVLGMVVAGSVAVDTGDGVLLANRIALAAAWSLDGKARSLDSDVNLGVRVPVGLQFYVLPRLELFGETVPGIDVTPSTNFDIDGGLGIRFHF